MLFRSQHNHATGCEFADAMHQTGWGTQILFQPRDAIDISRYQIRLNREESYVPLRQVGPQP